MMQTIRSSERYRFETDWLTTHWHFSFDHYHDPKNVNFGPLRVFNDDVVAPGGGFPMHGHREMEIVTYVIQGALEHRDDMGNSGVIRPGEVQRMSAGTGVRHSEFNHSGEEPVHLLQLWIQPSQQGLPPSWEQKSYSLAERSGKLLPIALPAGRETPNAVRIHQDAAIYTSLLAPGDAVEHSLGNGRRAYVFVIGGSLNVNGQTLTAGDQARISGETGLQLSAANGPGGAAADFLLLDLP